VVGRTLNVAGSDKYIKNGYITIRKFLENNKSTWATERKDEK